MPQVSGPHLGKLSDAIRQVFDPSSLEIFTRTTMDRRLADHSGGPDFQAVVFRLLDNANMEGWLPELVQKAIMERPKSQDLKDAAAAAGIPLPQGTAKPEMPVQGKPEALKLQKIVDEKSNFTDVDAFLVRLQRVRDSVCRVEVPGGGGTGLLVAPNLVMTNYHVVKKVIGGALSIASVNCIFGHKRNAAGEIEAGQTFAVDPAWTIIYRRYSQGDVAIPPTEPAEHELDYAILRLKTPAATAPVNSASAGTRGYLPLAEAEELPANEPVLILQHPQPEPGKPQMPMQLAIGTTLDSPWEKKRMRYDTRTLPGSSGSPSCNSDLQLVALHHAGDPQSELPATFNQGIPFLTIVKDLEAREAEFTAANVPAFWT